jgi:predicted exporter
MECQPRIVPTAVLRVLTTHSAPLNRWHRARVQVSWQLSRLLRRLTIEVAGRWRGTPSRMHPERFERELSRLVGLARKELRALVLVLNVNPTTDRLEHFLPTVKERTARFSDVIAHVAATGDDGVRLVDTRSMVEELGCDKVLPDGIHFNVEGHRRVAEMITREILDWLG